MILILNFINKKNRVDRLNNTFNAKYNKVTKIRDFKAACLTIIKERHSLVGLT